MSWKTVLLKNITTLPNSLNLFLMNKNHNAGFVYGEAYKIFKKKIQTDSNLLEIERLLLDSVNDAVQHIYYYNKNYDGKKIHSISEFEEKIGFIDKDIILVNYNSFLSRSIDLKRYDHITTGGTSGKPLELIAPKMRYVVEMATMHTLWEKSGYRFDIRGVIRNHRLGSRNYIVNPITREVLFDGFRLDEDYFRIVYKVLKNLDIHFIHCYPSTAYEFGLFILRNNLDSSFIKAFLSGSENIFDYQIDLIQNRLGIRFYNWYGHSEKLVLAGYCENTNDYHIEPTYGYFELINEKGKTIRESGRIGEIVGTSFHNPGMPLIRYRTGDFAEYVGDYCPACKRHVPIIRNIKGRWNGDKIFNLDGTFVTTTALNLHSDLYSVINGIQYVQKQKGQLDLLIIKSSDYKAYHEQALLNHFKTKLKPDTKIDIRYVERLIRMPNGKFMQLMSSVMPETSNNIASDYSHRI